MDVVALSAGRGCLETLLVRQGPGWAFPGRVVAAGEKLEEVALEVLAATTGAKPPYLEQLFTFESLPGDPREAVSIAYLALFPAPLPAPGDDGRELDARWARVDSLPRLSFGHDRLAEMAVARLRGKLSYSNIAYGLLPEEFTLGELQRLYEVVLGRTLDRRNFRRKVLLLGLLRPLRKHRRGAHRPARLYAFRRREPAFVDILSARSA